MNKVKLSKRLLKIASIVSGKNVCDVGCDHGKLSYYLLKNNIVDFAYVSDISKPSLEKAELLLSSESLKFKSIHCDGLLGFSGIHIDECIIAGMGGDEIINIIKSSPIDINSYILSPQHNIVEVKEFMLSNGYSIVFDKIIKDGHKFYDIFKCVKGGNCNYTDLHLHFGKEYASEELCDLRDYLLAEIDKVADIYSKVDSKKKEKLKKYLDLINKAQKDWNL